MRRSAQKPLEQVRKAVNQILLHLLQSDDVTSIGKAEDLQLDESGEDDLSSTYLLFRKAGVYRDIQVGLRLLPEPLQRVTAVLGTALMPVSCVSGLKLRKLDFGF